MRALHRVTITLLVPIAVLVTTMSPVAAHTGFESSDPANGVVVAGPVDEVTLVFTGEAQPAGTGFQVLDPSGEIREPSSAMTVDGAAWVLTFDPPLAGGVVGVRWSVKAPDAHPIEGSFSFTVDAPAPPAPSESSTPAPAAVAPAGSSDDLADFLATETSVDSARRIGAVGRILTLLGTLIGVGALTFAAAVLRGDHRDVRHVLFWVRRAGVLVIVGATIELLAQILVEGGGVWSAVWSLAAVGSVVTSSFGLAVILRLAGGTALSAGARLEVAHASQVADPVVAIKSLVGVGAGPRPANPSTSAAGDPGEPQSGEPFVHHGDHAWAPTFDSAGAALGAVLLVVAHLFDGHTVSAGNRSWTAVAAAVHVAGGAIWAGGLLMLAAVVWRRHRQGRDLRALQLALRFSVVATLALVAVGVAGLGLSVAVLDQPSELWATEWGRTLVVKTLFVGIAAAAGGYNHKVLIPELTRTPAGPGSEQRFRAIVTIEAVSLLAVVIATALLMGAAS